MTMLAELVDGVIGVDPHRDTLTAAAVSHLGGVLARTTTSADAAGYQQLLGFATATCPVVAAGRSREQAASAPA
jgi:transposase